MKLQCFMGYQLDMISHTINKLSVDKQLLAKVRVRVRFGIRVRVRVKFRVRIRVKVSSLKLY